MRKGRLSKAYLLLGVRDATFSVFILEIAREVVREIFKDEEELVGCHNDVHESTSRIR